MKLSLRLAAMVMLEANGVNPAVMDAMDQEAEVQQEVSVMVNEMLD